MLKKFCDGETQVNGEVAFSWSYPKVLKSPPKEIQGYLSVRDDKWTQTIPQKTLGNQLEKFWKRVHAQAGERKIKSTGIRAVMTQSSGEEIRKKFPNTKIERTQGHSFDDGAIIFSGRKVLPEIRLKYKPEMRITSMILPANSVNLCDPIINDLNQRIIRVDREIGALEGEKRRQKSEVRELSTQMNLDLEINILKILISQIKESLLHRFVATKRVKELKELLTPYIPLPISSNPNSLPSPVKRDTLPSAKKRILEEFKQHEPIPLRKQEKRQKRPRSTVVQEPKFKVPKVPRRIRPIMPKNKEEVEFAQMCANIDVAKARVEKREKRIDALVSSLFDCPAEPATTAAEELERDFAQFEFE